jgi:uncharacterized membrane protein
MNPGSGQSKAIETKLYVSHEIVNSHDIQKQQAKENRRQCFFAKDYHHHMPPLCLLSGRNKEYETKSEQENG